MHQQAFEGGHLAATRSKNLNDKTAETLGRRIVDGTYPEYSRMPGELELAKEFGAGRTRIREAMQRLAAWGMVLVRPKHKTIVLPKQEWLHFDPAVITLRLKHGDRSNVFRDLSETRISVEPDVAYLAAERATEADIEAMERAIERMKETSGNQRKFSANDAEFHRALFISSENSFFYSFFLTLGTMLEVGIVSHQKPRRPDAPISEHTEILNAVKEGDPDGAQKAMLNHLINSQREQRGHFGL